MLSFWIIYGIRLFFFDCAVEMCIFCGAARDIEYDFRISYRMDYLWNGFPFEGCGADIYFSGRNANGVALPSPDSLATLNIHLYTLCSAFAVNYFNY